MLESSYPDALVHLYSFRCLSWLAAQVLARLLLPQAPLFDVLRQLMGPLLVLGSAFSGHHPVQLALLKLAADCVEAHVSYLSVRRIILYRRPQVICAACAACCGLLVHLPSLPPYTPAAAACGVQVPRRQSF
jgi:hypothetical protein